MQPIAFLVALGVMLVGTLGTFLPSLPGLPLIWLAMLGYGFVEGFREMNPSFLLAALLVVAGSFAAEQYARAWGARRFGAGRAGAWGAIAGSIVGLFFLPLGLVLGPFLGAIAAELLTGRSADEAFRAGWGSLLGVLSSTVVNIILALGLTVAFALKVIF